MLSALKGLTWGVRCENKTFLLCKNSEFMSQRKSTVSSNCLRLVTKVLGCPSVIPYFYTRYVVVYKTSNVYFISCKFWNALNMSICIYILFPFTELYYCCVFCIFATYIFMYILVLLYFKNASCLHCFKTKTVFAIINVW